MVTAMAIIGVIDNYIAPLSEHIGLWQFHASRTVMAVPLIVLASALGLATLRVKRPFWVIVRSLAIGIAMLCYFGALGVMPIAEALAGLFTSPVFVLLLSALWLRQPIGPWRIGAVVAGFVGILLVLQPDPSSLRWVQVMPVVGGFFYAISVVITRQKCVDESPLALLLGTFGTLGIMGAVGLLFVSDPDGDFLTRGVVWPMWDALPLVALQAVGSLVAVFLIIRAYQWGDPTYLAVFEYSVMIFGPLYGWIALGQSVGAVQALGIGLIASAGIVIGLRSRAG